MEPPPDEPARLEALRRCGVLDTPPEQDFVNFDVTKLKRAEAAQAEKSRQLSESERIASTGSRSRARADLTLSLTKSHLKGRAVTLTAQLL